MCCVALSCAAHVVIFCTCQAAEGMTEVSLVGWLTVGSSAGNKLHDVLKYGQKTLTCDRASASLMSEKSLLHTISYEYNPQRLVLFKNK